MKFYCSQILCKPCTHESDEKQEEEQDNNNKDDNDDNGNNDTNNDNNNDVRTFLCAEWASWSHCRVIADLLFSKHNLFDCFNIMI